MFQEAVNLNTQSLGALNHWLPNPTSALPVTKGDQRHTNTDTSQGRRYAQSGNLCELGRAVRTFSRPPRRATVESEPQANSTVTRKLQADGSHVTHRDDSTSIAHSFTIMQSVLMEVWESTGNRPGRVRRGPQRGGSCRNRTRPHSEMCCLGLVPLRRNW